MKTIITILLSSLMISCQTESDNKKNEIVKINEQIDTLFIYTKNDTVHPTPILSGKWENTLQMYASKDSLEIITVLGEKVVKIFKVNDQKLAIVKDTMLRIYKYENNKFIETSMERVEGMELKITRVDINNDNYLDVLLVNGFAATNSETTVLIYDSESRTLKHKKYLDLPNIEIDSKNKLLKSKWYGSLCGCSSKEIYRVIKDSIELIKSVKIISHCDQPDATRKDLILIETNRNGKLKQDSIITTTKNAWSMFEKSVWNTEYNW